MTTAIFQILSSVIGLFVGLGLDALLGKWVAYFTIVWETKASEKSRAAYSKAIADFKDASTPNYNVWREARQSWKIPKPPKKEQKP